MIKFPDIYGKDWGDDTLSNVAAYYMRILD